MKKTISLLLSLLLIVSLVPMAAAADGTAAKSRKGSFGAYKHVYIFGVDGAGGAIERVDTPNFDRIFGEGAVKYNARAEVYTDSGPNWGSVLSGASNLRTMYTNGNTSAEGEDWGNGFQMRVYPTIYRFVRRAMPDAVLASYANYSNINDRIIEDGLDVEKVHYGDDASLTNAICDYFDAGNKPTLFYSHIDCVDGAGHHYGSTSPEYAEAIGRADEYLGQVYDALARNDMLGDTLLLWITDHGHKPEGGHGRFSMDESMTTIAAVGKTVIKGGTFDCDTRNRDISAIALHALGVCKPITMSSRVPAGLFQDYCGEVRPIWRDLPDALVSAVMWLYTLTTVKK